MSSRAGFFRTAATPAGKKQGVDSYGYIDVGNELFHALATAFIDGMASGQKISEATLKTILDRWSSYFPNFKLNQSYLNAQERMALLLNSARKSDLVVGLAYIFRQLAVDEVYRKPLAYQGVFNGLDSETPKAYLRCADTVLPKEIIPALAQVLQIKINLSFKEPGKELGSRQIFGDDKSFMVDLQVQGGYYFPRVRNKSDFKYTGQVATPSMRPVEPVSTGTLEDIIGLIARDRSVKMNSYEQYHKILAAMVLDGDLTKVILIDLYSKFLPCRSSLDGHSGVLHEERQKTVVGGELIGGADRYVSDLLVSSLSWFLATEQVQPDPFFEAVEIAAPTTRRRSSQSI
jgi:hypothetical protein